MDYITCILNDPVTARSVLRTGRLLSQRLQDSQLRVLCPRPARDPNFMPTEEVMTDERRERFIGREETRLRKINRLFEAWKINDARAAVFEEVEGDVAEIVAAAARQATLVVAGAAYGTEQTDAAATIETVLAERASAIVVVPKEPPVLVGTCPGIAWKRNVQLNAAISSALKLLLTADQVHLLIEAEKAEEDAKLQDLVMTLQRHAVPVEIHHVELGGRHAGQYLIQEAHRAGSDLLVMGAHTQSWFRDLLLGGRSKDVLAHLDLPVLLHG
ncbi:universal stress protein (plasmid) [Lichenicola cladoniae]|uniref:Universal stress protein n=1 Tax=Lichenicola cladoniae TaxID=1484109 RepID=A0A6M8HZ64_9PROT|nr:universal stress protein [Lichenicola cladoniae]NPD67663.1 universal stress protein [Acetobacteraceae bacterium]QKE93823.1 universal stress protein [Lichenicola cladoniae]